MIWVETPLNPTSVASDISYYSELSRSKGGILVVDSTFAPPPLSDPFVHGADYVMHSATKYFGGHSDLLAGTISCKDLTKIHALREDRIYLGSIPSGHTSWLLLRSLRTLHMRVQQQSSNATILVKKLLPHCHGKILSHISHTSLQSKDQSNAFVKNQMPGGDTPCFAMYFQSSSFAKEFACGLQLFHHATSIGGVESLVEWRFMSDSKCDQKLVRVSVGVENVEDLANDMITKIKALDGTTATTVSESSVGMGVQSLSQAEPNQGVAGDNDDAGRWFAWIRFE